MAAARAVHLAGALSLVGALLFRALIDAVTGTAMRRLVQASLCIALAGGGTVSDDVVMGAV